MAERRFRLREAEHICVVQVTAALSSEVTGEKARIALEAVGRLWTDTSVMQYDRQHGAATRDPEIAAYCDEQVKEIVARLVAALLAAPPHYSDIADFMVWLVERADSYGLSSRGVTILTENVTTQMIGAARTAANRKGTQRSEQVQAFSAVLRFDPANPVALVGMSGQLDDLESLAATLRRQMNDLAGQASEGVRQKRTREEITVMVQRLNRLATDCKNMQFIFEPYATADDKPRLRAIEQAVQSAVQVVAEWTPALAALEQALRTFRADVITRLTRPLQLDYPTLSVGEVVDEVERLFNRLVLAVADEIAAAFSDVDDARTYAKNAKTYRVGLEQQYWHIITAQTTEAFSQSANGTQAVERAWTNLGVLDRLNAPNFGTVDLAVVENAALNYTDPVTEQHLSNRTDHRVNYAAKARDYTALVVAKTQADAQNTAFERLLDRVDGIFTRDTKGTIQRRAGVARETYEAGLTAAQTYLDNAIQVYGDVISLKVTSRSAASLIQEARTAQEQAGATLGTLRELQKAVTQYATDEEGLYAESVEISARLAKVGAGGGRRPTKAAPHDCERIKEILAIFRNFDPTGKYVVTKRRYDRVADKCP